MNREHHGIMMLREVVEVLSALKTAFAESDPFLGTRYEAVLKN